MLLMLSGHRIAGGIVGNSDFWEIRLTFSWGANV